MAFFTVFARWITISESIFSLVIYRYTPNTNKIGTKLFRLAVLLKVLNIIYKAISLLILDSLITII